MAGYGLVVDADKRESESCALIDDNWELEIRRPDGSTLRVEEFAVGVSTPPSPESRRSLLLKGLTNKSDVPIGSELWASVVG